jgi:hypothetical protein
MTRALFEVGERVRLVSKSLPQYNGEYTVDRVLQEGEVYNSRIDGKPLRNNGGGYSYLLDKPFISPRHSSGEVCWDESALRKIYPPSNFSFEQLLSELKQGKMSTIEA